MPTEIPGVIISTPIVHGDERGRFAEIYRASAMPAAFAQSNHSRSSPGVLRGLHYHQHQADLWYLVSGRAQDAHSADWVITSAGSLLCYCPFPKSQPMPMATSGPL